ncbi:LysR family transcriptional regulator [Sphingorhabdus sp. Alg239-R122]|uniref:LysR family transcriptional regulator n=1 Tax=Sphingorhabdus sp. Alg239-R122 TaxID=2305989 RepID=UPI0013DC33C0|nr:LysR family transcriptional regulator [Sphingorhabdus sp. Alg239-R122]
MELKWLEDFICVAEKGHFAQAAEIRFVTQSALSRRIQALELWIGTPLFDRTEHPIKLTAAGVEFIKTARHIVEQSYEARAIANEYSKIGENSIKISCLHTLALKFIPDVISDLQNKIGSFSATIVADAKTVEEYLNSLYTGACDFFISYNHVSIPFDVGPMQFPHIEIASHHLRPYQSDKVEPIILDENSTNPIPYIEYSGTSFMSRVFEQLLQKAPFRKRLQTVYRASLVESMMVAAQHGFGLTWLPETVVSGDPGEHGLRLVSDNFQTSLQIRVYRSASNTNPLVTKIWEQLQIANNYRS